MKKHIINFFIENSNLPVEIKELQNKYFLEIKEIKQDTCDSCELRKIRKKYLDILLKK